MSAGGKVWLVIGLVVVVMVIFAVVKARREAQIMASGTDEQRAALRARRAQNEINRAVLMHGDLRSQVVCPHCMERGRVRCKEIKNKKGISGGKATGAILTGGVSMLATGLSRKEAATQAYCENCKSSWQF